MKNEGEQRGTLKSPESHYSWRERDLQQWEVQQWHLLLRVHTSVIRISNQSTEIQYWRKGPLLSTLASASCMQAIPAVLAQLPAWGVGMSSYY